MRGDQILSRVIGKPLMVTPDYAEIFTSALAQELPGQGIEQIIRDGRSLDASGMRAATEGYGRNGGKPFDQQDNIAIIEIAGTVAHKTGNVRPMSGLVGCDGMSFALDAALDDDDIDGVLLHIDSPGGEIAGVFDLADEIFEARQHKPVWCLINELGASAAYALASSASRIIAPRTAMIGSIGVVLMHRDRSQELAKQGQTITFIHSGARKIDGNSAQPLPPDVRQRLQADVDRVYELFTRTTARNRGLDERAIRSTEAGLFGSDEALRLGLIDEIGPAATVLERFNDALRNGTAGNRPSRRKAAATRPKRHASKTLERMAADSYGAEPPRDTEPRKPINVAQFYR